MNSSNKTAKSINSKASKRPVQGKKLTSQVLKSPQVFKTKQNLHFIFSNDVFAEFG